jgi:hypothetical protein
VGEEQRVSQGCSRDKKQTRNKRCKSCTAKITWSWLLESEVSCCSTLGMALTMRLPTSSTLMFLMAPVA